jgi:hypothetical protein
MPERKKLTRQEEEDEYQKLKEKLKSILEMRENIDEQLDHVFSESKLSMSEIQSYLDNPKNFPEGQYNTLQNRRKNLENLLWSEVGEEAKRKWKGNQIAKKKKKQKRKFVGRRRKWIQMD